MSDPSHLPNPPDGSNQTYVMEAGLRFRSLSGWGKLTISSAGITIKTAKLLDWLTGAKSITHAQPTLKIEKAYRFHWQPHWMLIESAGGYKASVRVGTPPEDLAHMLAVCGLPIRLEPATRLHTSYTNRFELPRPPTWHI